MHSISTSVFNGSVLTATHLQGTTYQHPTAHRQKIRKGEKRHLRPTGLHIAPVLHVNRVHLAKVIHVGQKHVDLDHLGDVGTGRLEDMGQVLDALVLASRQISVFQLADYTYGVGLDIAVDQFASHGIHRHCTGAVHDAIGDDGLGVDARQGLGGLVGEHGGLGRHDEEDVRNLYSLRGEKQRLFIHR